MEDITVQELRKKLEEKENFILIDVREVYEHHEFNIGGELAPLRSELGQKIESMADQKNNEIILYCRSGNRSGIAKQLFEQAGFKNVRNLLGGMLAWREAFPS